MPASTIAVHPVPAASPPARPAPRQPLDPRQEDDNNFFDPTDLSFIKKLAAIGDSHAAGIGAGDRLGNLLGALDPTSGEPRHALSSSSFDGNCITHMCEDWSCSRHDHAYPYLINNDRRLGDPSGRNFQFRACSGAVTQDVLENQIPSVDSGQQVVLLSIGGNDAELLHVLNQCVFQWGVLNWEQVALAKTAATVDKEYQWAKDVDWDSLGHGCDAQLDRTESIINSDALSSNIDKVLDAAKAKLADDGMVYHTGYGKFFGEDLSPGCDSVSWATWFHLSVLEPKSYNIWEPRKTLKADLRRRMNKLVEAANEKLKAAAERAGDKVKFVDYDTYIGKFGGRYCEPGVDESTTESSTRIRLMFYELNTLDPLGATPWKRFNHEELQGTFAGDLDILAQITMMMDPDAELVQGNKVETDNTTVPAGGTFIETQEEGIRVVKSLPDGYGRVFHPQILLHEIITNLVIYNMISHNQEKNADRVTYWADHDRDSSSDTDCAMDRPARIPWDVFYGPEFNVASDFCGHTGGGQNTMAKDGSWDIGCGIYSWNIRIPSDLDPHVPLEFGSQGCNNEDDFPGHQDMHEDDIHWGAIGTCAGVEDELGPGDSWEQQIGGSWRGTTFNFKVKWMPGCITDVKKQKLNDALGINGACIDLFYGNWKNCEF
ncbi:hypothetical protein DL765_007244 [Monosporascus sp. GIB2]|nr:hypothetical protein DL765_007244 [Monosporascus sp. GIB2]